MTKRDERQPMMIKAFYIGMKEENICFKTGVGAIGKTDSETRHLFESAKKKNSDPDFAMFLLDLHDEYGDIIDTVFLTKENYKIITGEPVMTRDEYRKIDTQFWENAKKQFKTAMSK